MTYNIQDKVKEWLTMVVSHCASYPYQMFCCASFSQVPVLPEEKLSAQITSGAFTGLVFREVVPDIYNLFREPPLSSCDRSVITKG